MYPKLPGICYESTSYFQVFEIERVVINTPIVLCCRQMNNCVHTIERSMACFTISKIPVHESIEC